MVMEPVEIYDAEEAYKKGRPVFVFDLDNNELIHINKIENKNAIMKYFTQPCYLYYIYGENTNEK